MKSDTEKMTFRVRQKLKSVMYTAVLFTFSLSLFTLASCSGDENFPSEDDNPLAVSFSAQMNGIAVSHSTTRSTMSTTPSGVPYVDYVAADGFATRAFYPQGTSIATAQTRTTNDGNEWESNDGIGIFMLTTGGTISTTSDLLTDNIRYNATPNSSDAKTASFAPHNASDIIYYPQVGNVDFVAYYPYQSTLTTSYDYNITVSDQSDPSQIDVLYAKVSNVPKSHSAVNLQFKHAMSKITLNVVAGDGITPAEIQHLASTAVTFGKMPVTATMALQDGTITADTDLTQTFNPLNDIAVPPPLKSTTTNYDASFSAILVPQATGTYVGRTVVFTVNRTPYTWNIPNDHNFAAGNHYTYPVTVTKNGITVGTPTITDWTTSDNGSGTTEVLAVPIQAGTFIMGSSDYGPEHQVTLTQDFYMSKYQVTRDQFCAFLNATNVGENRKGNVSGFGEQTLFGYNQWWVPQWNTTLQRWESNNTTPMIYITWYGAKAYADWVGGTLPTEAQWEYACRAGTTTAYSFGDSDSDLGNYAWYSSNSSSEPHAVGLKLPNPWGLYDMHGNVFEWCSDWYGSYPSSAVTDPTGPTTGSYRVLRGGSWGSYAQSCRSASRTGSNPGNVYDFIGFRVVFVL